MTPLRDALLEYAPDLGSDPPDLLESALMAALERGRAAWPQVGLEPAAFARHVGRMLVADGVKPGKAADAVHALHAEDAYLAAGCVTGDQAACKAFANQLRRDVPLYVSRVDRSPSFASDVTQELSRKMLVAEEGRAAKLATYTGRGPLTAWLRVSAVREAQSMKRGKAQQASAPIDEHLKSSELDPELRALRKKYATEFAQAMRETLKSLSQDERNVLRLHYLDGLSIDEVGTAYKVSRATAARWLAKARGRIIEQVQGALAERLGSSAPAPKSLLALVKSELDLSLTRQLKE